MLVAFIKVHESNIFHYNSNNQHSDEGGQRGHFDHNPAAEVCGDSEHGECEQLPARRRRLSHHYPDNHPYQNT